MTKAAKKTSKNTKLKLVSFDKKQNHLRAVQDDFEAKLEYEQNKRKFLDFKPRNKNQKTYMEYLKSSRLVFGIGPAGTGKSICPTIYACELLESKEIDKIIVTRPMVGCDEDMGALPGDEHDKYIGWVGPILEILETRLGKKKVATYINYGKIVLKPLMMMRGSTFRDAFVILDEAQNTTSGQMKMFLTRLGEGSKAVINGDLEQTDLKGHQINGLEEAIRKLSKSKIIKIVEFTDNDIVRDQLVREIIKAYRKK